MKNTLLISLIYFTLDLLNYKINSQKYKKVIQKPINKLSAAIFYIVYPLIIYELIIKENLKEPYIKVLGKAILLGLATYGVYHITNYTILKDWHINFIIHDLSWGIILTCIISWLLHKYNKNN